MDKEIDRLRFEAEFLRGIIPREQELLNIQKRKLDGLKRRLQYIVELENEFDNN